MLVPTVEVLRNYIGGEWTGLPGAETAAVRNPATDQVLARVPMTPRAEVERAISLADQAFWGWRSTPPLDRARRLMKLRNLLEENQQELARTLTCEHGKTLAEAGMEIERAIENLEVASGVTSMMMGHLLEDVAKGIDEYAVRQPLGVFAGLNPFNFPAMIPFWFMPYALATGNCFVVKSSSRVPMTMVRIFELIDQAGFPPGVVSLVNGSHEVADTLMESPLIKGISFVGSTRVGRYVYRKSTENLKRAQVQAGAKNFGIVMPDANFDRVIPNIVASAFDCTGQRCLALATVLCVGSAGEEVKKRIVEAAHRIKVGFGLDPGTQMGPVISREALAKIEGYIERGLAEGATLLVDGRGIEVDSYPNGYWIGPTVFDHCRREMAIVNEEIFGPVLCLMQIEDMDEGLEIIHANPYGNAATIYTQDGGAAREFKYRARCGNLGINIGVAAPMAFFHFGGSKDSFYGDLHAQGRDAFEFFTDAVVVVERWF